MLKPIMARKGHFLSKEGVETPSVHPRSEGRMAQTEGRAQGKCMKFNAEFPIPFFPEAYPIPLPFLVGVNKTDLPFNRE